MRTLYLEDKNKFYAPASDECWVLLAKEIMASYAMSYVNQIVCTAFTQAEYDLLDQKKYAPQRRSILRKIKHGPLRNVVDLKSIYAGLEKKRKENLKIMGVRWRDSYVENLDRL